MRRSFSTLMVILFLGAGTGLWAWFATASGRGSTPPAARPVMLPPSIPGLLRVMTANIRISEPTDGENAWTNRRELVLKTFLKYQPDILGCQEVSPAQGAYLNKELAGGYAYYPRAGIGTVAAGPTTGGGGGTAAHLLAALGDSLATLNTLYFRSDRFDVIDGEAGLVLPDELQATASENTFFTLAVLREKVAPKAPQGALPRHLIVVDVHFRHGEDVAIRCAARLREKIVAWQNKYPQAKPDIILMGDINQDRTSRFYPFLTGSAPTLTAHDPVLIDSFDYAQRTAATPAPLWGTYQAFTGKVDRAWPTDLIFFNGRLQLAPNGAAQILRDHGPPPQNRLPSDHFFVMADLIPG